MLLRPSARSPRRPGLGYEWKPSVAATPCRYGIAVRVRSMFD